MANDQIVMAPHMQDADFPAFVQRILTERFGNGVNVSRDPGEQKVSGYIVSQGFADQEPVERQREVRAFLNQVLGPDVQGVSIILTYSVDEYQGNDGLTRFHMLFVLEEQQRYGRVKPAF